MSVIVGVDPGQSGALAAITRYGLVDILDMPLVVDGKTKSVDIGAVHDWLTLIGPVHLTIIEQVQGVQGSGATSAFNFGLGFGQLLGMLVALRRPHQLVRPQRWTKDLAVGPDKGAHRRAAQGFWPDQADRFARVKDDGRADAALLARWGMHLP